MAEIRRWKQQVFLRAVKERYIRNSIHLLYDSDGNQLTTSDDIQAEINHFYTQLLGSSTTELLGVDLKTMRSGSQLHPKSAQILIALVTESEIDLAIQSIDDAKSPGIDGFNAFFFKKTWQWIKSDIYVAMKDFFATGYLAKEINCTSVTLVPKVPNPSSVKDFRPIACCSVLYKIIAKILNAGMQRVIREVVNYAQCGFIPHKNISDNIILASELIKGYN